MTCGIALASALLLYLAIPAAARPQAPSPESGRSAAEEWSWRGPDGKPLPFRNEDEALEFLRTATEVASEPILEGTSEPPPLKVRLRKDDIEANAVFRRSELKLERAVLGGKVVRGFHDSYLFECAAYELSRLLRIPHVPPCVTRRLGTDSGTLQLWVEGAMTESGRRKGGRTPPAELRWLRQQQLMRVFDALVCNFDRNLGNMLIDPEWKLWFIDHTRTFKTDPTIRKPDRILWCERGAWERLQTLDRKLLSKHLASYLSGLQIKRLLTRRDLLLDHFNKRIEELGEIRVIFDWAQPGDLTDVTDKSLLGVDDLPESPEDPRPDE